MWPTNPEVTHQTVGMGKMECAVHNGNMKEWEMANLLKEAW